jgi:hypothetical protein
LGFTNFITFSESLCSSNSSEGGSSTFYFNTTTTGDTRTGLVTWNLPFSSGENTPLQYDSQSLGLSYSPVSNVAMALFSPSGGPFYQGFDKDNKMYYPSYDETGTQHRIYQWYMCHTNRQGYNYVTLNWLVAQGASSPDNPTCVSVNVKRVFV